MLKVDKSSVTIDPGTSSYLQEQQAGIDQEPDFDRKKDAANARWQRKASPHFSHLKEQLKTCCVGRGYCNYCEHNEAADVEHIYPKKLFPERTFSWQNYLLACKQCNQDSKLDAFAVFDPHHPTDIIRYEKRQRNTTQPPSADSAFIDPCTENPMDLLWLHLPTGRFVPHPDRAHNPREQIKADYTLKLLRLNERFADVRKEAAGNFYDDLYRYVGVKQSHDFETMRPHIRYPQAIDESRPFDQEKRKALRHFEQSIKTRLHITVWHEIVRQIQHFPSQFPTWTPLFAAAPEARSWV